MCRLVFVDESGANTKMTRLRGRALAGGRLLARIPHGHYQTSTLISGMRLQGPCAPWLFEGPMDGEMFLAWVRQGLAPVLQTGDLVIMDNLATHKMGGVREAIEPPERGCSTCRPIRRTSTPSKTCGARSSRSCAGKILARRRLAPGRHNGLRRHFQRRLPWLFFCANYAI